MEWLRRVHKTQATGGKATKIYFFTRSFGNAYFKQFCDVFIGESFFLDKSARGFL